MLNRSASLAMSTSVLIALPGKLDIKRHSPSILYISRYERIETVSKLYSWVNEDAFLGGGGGGRGVL